MATHFPAVRAAMTRYFVRSALPALFAFCCGVAFAADAPSASEDLRASYAMPHRLVDVDAGRKLNLYCIGEGAPTVVFESGLSDWSNTWALIQPMIAKRTRTCSYDRAGMGYSDPVAPGARMPEAAVQDLKTLLDRAGIDGPLVLVGHSLGGFYAKLFALTYPERIAGLVLVDPSEDRLWPRVWPKLEPQYGGSLVRKAARGDEEGIGELLAHFRDCANDAREGRMDDARYRQCTDPPRAPLGDAILAERKRLQESPAYQQTQYDELLGSPFVTHADADRRYAALFSAGALGKRPVVVLTHGLHDMSEDTSILQFLSYKLAHEQSAALSRRGTHVIVPYSRHNLQVENPDVVIEAIGQVLDALPTHTESGNARPH